MICTGINLKITVIIIERLLNIESLQQTYYKDLEHNTLSQ